MKAHSPVQKLEKIKIISIKNETRRNITKIARSTILNLKKKTYKEKIEEKFKKFDMRIRKNVFYIKEISLIKKPWILLFIVAGVGKVWKVTLNRRRVFKERVNKLGRAFYLYAKSIGKFKNLLIKIKKSILLRVLTT